MNISTGISLIDLRGAGNTPQVSGKNYIWPKYHEGRVEKVNILKPREEEPAYFKPVPAEKEKLQSLMSKIEIEYNSYGKTDIRKSFMQPGSFFDALA